jgi:hypothetical protein
VQDEALELPFFASFPQIKAGSCQISEKNQTEEYQTEEIIRRYQKK